MTESIRLAELSRKDLEGLVLTLQGYAKTLQKIVEEQAERSSFVTRELSIVNETYARRMGRIAARYVSGEEAAIAAERAVVNCRNWSRFDTTMTSAAELAQSTGIPIQRGSKVTSA